MVEQKEGDREREKQMKERERFKFWNISPKMEKYGNNYTHRHTTKPNDGVANMHKTRVHVTVGHYSYLLESS